MSAFKRVIFISDNDTVIGPMAVTIITSLLKDKGFIFESRGMVVLFPEPYNQKAVDAAKERYMNLPKRFSRQLTKDDFTPDTLLLTETKEQRDRIYSENKQVKNVFTIAEFAREQEKEIVNPVGGSAEDYLNCFDELYSLVFKVADSLMGFEATMH